MRLVECLVYDKSYSISVRASSAPARGTTSSGRFGELATKCVQSLEENLILVYMIVILLSLGGWTEALQGESGGVNSCY